MFIVEPEIGEKAWIVTIPHIIRGEIFIIYFADIIKEIQLRENKKFYNVNNFHVPMNRMAIFTFGGISIQNDKFNKHKRMMEDKKIIKDYSSKAGRLVNVNEIIEPSWWQN